MGRPPLRQALESQLRWVRTLPPIMLTRLVTRLMKLLDKKREDASRGVFGLPPTRS